MAFSLLPNSSILICLLGLASNVLGQATCPLTENIVYTPFQPWFHFVRGSSQQCWTVASCVFLQADEARKQQFASTALVMGLFPLMLRDIAWPERRSVPLSKPLPKPIETLVRALGLEPDYPLDTSDLDDWWERNSISRWARKSILLAIVVGVVVLLAAYTAIALVEIYSKRCSIGCPYGVFVLTWYVGAIIPAAIHTWSSYLKERNEYVAPGENHEHQHERRAQSAVQGNDEWVIVQLSWAAYYITATLIFSSIMAVTVIELFVWILVCSVVTAASKMLAFFLCIYFGRK